MKEYKITDARQNLYGIVSDVNVGYNPVKIVNSRGENAVLISEREWNGLMETLYLESIPGYVDSILKADKETNWDDAQVYKPGEKW